MLILRVFGFFWTKLDMKKCFEMFKDLSQIHICDILFLLKSEIEKHLKIKMQ